MRYKIGLVLFFLISVNCFPGETSLTKEQHRDVAERWGIALSGILTVVNRSSLDTLEPDARRSTWKQVLKQWWGIESSEDLEESLKTLWNKGHSSRYMKYKKIIERSKGQSLSQIIKNSDLPKEEALRLTFVATYYKKIGKHSLWAWDLGRSVSLCRWGYAAGYMSEEEARKRIKKIALRVQREFSSWHEFGTNFIYGRLFWAAGRSDYISILDEAGKAFDYLLCEGGIWTLLPWDFNLNSVNPRQKVDYGLITAEKPSPVGNRKTPLYRANYMLIDSLTSQSPIVDKQKNSFTLKLTYSVDSADKAAVKVYCNFPSPGKWHEVGSGIVSRGQGELTFSFEGVPQKWDMDTPFAVTVIMYKERGKTGGEKGEVLTYNKQAFHFDSYPVMEMQEIAILRYSEPNRMRGYLYFEKFDDQNRVTGKSFFFGDGEDDTWFTGDDIRASIVNVEYNDRGEVAREWVSQPGKDKTAFTADDILTGYTEYTYTENGHLLDMTFYRNQDQIPGWEPGENSISSYTLYKTDDEGRILYEYRSRGSGPDKQWGTGDDLKQTMAFFEIDAEGLVRREIRSKGIHHFGRTDAETEITSIVINEYNQIGRLVRYYRFASPGEDNKWFTRDDLLQQHGMKEYTVNGVLNTEVMYKGPGLDAVLFSDDDRFLGKNEIFYEDLVKRKSF